MAHSSGAGDADALTALSLTEVLAKIHSRTVTSTELVKALLDRINIYNPKVNCHITAMGKDALAQAAGLDAEQKAGKFRGTLHGIPIGLKDNISIPCGFMAAGMPIGLMIAGPHFTEGKVIALAYAYQQAKTGTSVSRH